MDIFSYFRNCKNCGRYSFRTDLFCAHCMVELEKQRTPKNYNLRKNKIVIRPLYEWKKRKEIVGNLIRGLKGGRPRKALGYFALELVNRNYRKGRYVVIPVPSTKVGVKDHSYFLAEEIARICDCEMKDILFWKNKTIGQKFLKKSARFGNKMGSKERVSGYDAVIIVDDLVTTGATVLAARDAIKGLNKIEVWTLACREY